MLQVWLVLWSTCASPGRYWCWLFVLTTTAKNVNASTARRHGHATASESAADWFRTSTDAVSAVSNDRTMLCKCTVTLVADWTVLHTVSVAVTDVTDYFVVCGASFCLVAICFQPPALSVCVYDNSQWVQADFVLFVSSLIVSHCCGIFTDSDVWFSACCIVYKRGICYCITLSVCLNTGCLCQVYDLFDVDIYYLRQGGYVFVVVCLSISNFAQKLLNRFAWNFQRRLAMGQWTND